MVDIKQKLVPVFTPAAAAVAAVTALTALATPPAQAAEARFERFSYEGRAQERATPSAKEFRNPILSGYYPDPSVTRVGQDYYLVNSSFTHYPGLPIFHSRDLVSWRQVGNAIDRPGQFSFKGLRSSRGIFAPDISHKDGLFYIVTTCVDCGGNVVMTAADAAGPWSDPKPLAFDGIDPSIFWDDDGKAYIVNNDAPIGAPLYDGHRAIWVQEFDPKTQSMVGERTLIVNGGVDINAKPSWIEGPHLLKRGGYYYLIAAEGGTGDQHSEVVFRSNSVRGPFKPYEGNPILSQRTLDATRANPVTSAGHAKFVQTPDGEWWATFLATRPYGPDLYNIGRETFLLPVSWQDGWPMVLEPGKRIPFTAPRPRLPADPRPALPFNGDFSYVEEFGGTLPAQWIGVRVPTKPFYRLQDGKLHMWSSGRLGDLDQAPSFIARRQQHHIATVSTTLTFDAQHEGDRAGLVAYQSDESHLFFGIARIGGKRKLALYTRAKANEDTLVAAVPVEGNAGTPVMLTISADGGRMAFRYGIGGKVSTLADKVDATFLSTRKAGGFVGTIIGPYVGQAASAR
jgi:alpha-N-arabinofuranosidase